MNIMQIWNATYEVSALQRLIRGKTAVTKDLCIQAIVNCKRWDYKQLPMLNKPPYIQTCCDISTKTNLPLVASFIKD